MHPWKYLIYLSLFGSLLHLWTYLFPSGISVSVSKKVEPAILGEGFPDDTLQQQLHKILNRIYS